MMIGGTDPVNGRDLAGSHEKKPGSREPGFKVLAT